MIVRYSIKCLTCDHPHTVRIGMGQEEEQVHKFLCRQCMEEIVVRMDVDYQAITAIPSCVQNCEAANEVPGADIVNVDANFLVPRDLQGVDMVMPRVTQVIERFNAQEQLLGTPRSRRAQAARPHRRPAYAEEWKHLKKAWSLARNGKEKLSNRKTADASTRFYPQEALDGLPDWVWRFSLSLCNPAYNKQFADAIDVMKQVEPKSLLDDFSNEFSNSAAARAERYFSVFKAFFTGYHEFGQVYFAVVSGTPVKNDDEASSVDFDAVKMFYGDTFEHFSSLIDYLSLFNNVILGRKYDKFNSLTLDAYRKLDKPGRFANFSMNAPFMAICAEADNNIRNASHHGSFILGQDRVIRYRSGKGSMGPEHQISYGSYLDRCVRIFLQVATLLRLELIMSTSLPIKPPL